MKLSKYEKETIILTNEEDSILLCLYIQSGITETTKDILQRNIRNVAI